jgi:hypothetical protein
MQLNRGRYDVSEHEQKRLAARIGSQARAAIVDGLMPEQIPHTEISQCANQIEAFARQEVEAVLARQKSFSVV